MTYAFENAGTKIVAANLLPGPLAFALTVSIASQYNETHAPNKTTIEPVLLVMNQPNVNRMTERSVVCGGGVCACVRACARACGVCGDTVISDTAIIIQRKNK